MSVKYGLLTILISYSTNGHVRAKLAQEKRRHNINPKLSDEIEVEKCSKRKRDFTSSFVSIQPL